MTGNMASSVLASFNKRSINASRNKYRINKVIKKTIPANSSSWWHLLSSFSLSAEIPLVGKKTLFSNIYLWIFEMRCYITQTGLEFTVWLRMTSNSSSPSFHFPNSGFYQFLPYQQDEQRRGVWGHEPLMPALKATAIPDCQDPATKTRTPTRPKEKKIDEILWFTLTIILKLI